MEKYGDKFGIQVEAMLTTKDRIDTFRELVQDTIDEFWDEDIWLEYCPDEDYDYEANGIEEPEAIDPDNEYFEDTEITIRDKMISMATEAFKEGWASK